MKSWSKAAVGLFGFTSSFLFIGSAFAELMGGSVTVVSHVDIIPDAYKKGAEEAAEQLFRAESAASEKDQGSMSFIVLRELNEPNHFTIVETWQNANAYALHAGSPHTVQFRQQIQPILGSPFDARLNRPIH